MSVEHHGALPKGYRLQEYRIERVLGFGGFGITYLAIDTNLDKTVAIKEYLPNDLALRANGAAVVPKATECREDFQWGLDRFLDEARALARFRHPNLVPVHRFFEANGSAYVVMEYEAGERLTDILRRTVQSVPEEEALALLDGLLDGLAAVHRGGYLHRDVKPGNIIVRADGTPVLIDFGAARQALGQRSQAVTSIVTPGYAPLEQYTTSGNQGPWTDIYAAGAVAYQIVTGAPPPEATARARQDPYRRLAGQKFPDYSDAFLRAVDWALRVDEHERPQTVSDFHRALHGEIDPPAEGSDVTKINRPPDDPTILKGAPPSRDVRRGVLSATAPAPQPSSQRKLVIGVAAAIVVLLVAGGGYFYVQQQGEQQRLEAAALERKAAEDRARLAADQARAEQARRAQAERDAAEKAAAEDQARRKAQAEREAAERAAAERAAAEKAAAEKAARERAASLQPDRPPESSQRAAAEARENAARARDVSADARRMADTARERARLAREQIAPAARAAAGPNALRRDYANGAKYAGAMNGTARQGLGVLTTPSGYRYEGEWRGDAAAGLGVSQDSKGERYEGEWSNGDRGGRGVYAWANGQRYEGEYVEGKRDGIGILVSPTGWRTEAQWSEGAATGLGVTYNNAGQRFEGGMQGGKYHGPGVYTWPDKQRYEGMYRDDKRNGYGILYMADGSKRAGLWQDGNLVKPD